MSRSPSQSQLANERKISQLGKQTASTQIETQMMKREIEVYKSTLAENEKVSDVARLKMFPSNICLENVKAVSLPRH